MNSEITAGDEWCIGPKITRWGDEQGVKAEIAHDGIELVLRWC